MTNTLSLWLGALIAAFIAVDAFAFDWELTLFLSRRLAELIEWMAFWR